MLLALSGVVGGANEKVLMAIQPVKPVPQNAPYQAYWLMPPRKGKKAEYQTLLIAHGPIEALAGHKTWSNLPFDNMAMTFQTYRRDSFWDEPFHNVQQFGDVDAKATTTVVDGTTFSYEPCPLQDVVKLLEKPLGAIPIHRRVSPLSGA